MKQLKEIIVGLIVWGFPAILLGQSSVSGTVTDENGETVAGANIRIEGTYRGTHSDAAGKYSLSGLPEGEVTLVITFIGYESQSQAVTVSDQPQTLDVSLKRSAVMADEVVIKATRASERDPIAHSNISKEELEKNNLGQDLPILLNQQPNTVVNSDAGAGVGYTGFRIRGSDPSRINVTINGIPLNDAESQGVFWVNMPDFASSLENIQIQRGVGTSTNGAGAFGATVNLQTNALQREPYAVVSNSYGSFNTYKNTVMLGSGLINGRWTFDGRLSNIQSDGFIDRASSDLKSFFLSGGYYGKQTIVKANVFRGREVTYQAWNGIPEARLNGDEAGIEEHIANNFLSEAEAANLRNSDNRTYNGFTYDDQTDNYWQDHYQLHISHQFKQYFTLNTSFHYTYGRGYFEQFRADDDLADYNLDNVIAGGDTISSSDIIRRRWLDNDFYGTTFSLQYDNRKKFKATLGGAYNRYEGDHFGEVIWARFASNSNIRDRFYENEATKTDFNIYGKVNYALRPGLTLFGDLQFRAVSYETEGLDIDQRDITLEDDLQFFNPKAGVTWNVSPRSTVYGYFGMASREPTRNDYIDADNGNVPDAETMQDFELGYQLRANHFAFSANAYYMNYQDQLVLTGQLNDVGTPVRVNVDKSYRAGIELTGSVRLLKNLTWSGNVAWSQNKISDFTELVSNSFADGSFEIIANEFSSTDISYSPEVVAGGTWTYSPLKGLDISIISKYVGEQFLDNTSDDNRKLDAFFVNDLRINYRFKSFWLFKEASLNLLVNNLFDEEYEPNGYTFNYAFEGNLVVENFYYPQAGRNYLAGLTLKF